jgi:hypothetical protein
LIERPVFQHELDDIFYLGKLIGHGQYRIFTVNGTVFYPKNIMATSILIGFSFYDPGAGGERGSQFCVEHRR